MHDHTQLKCYDNTVASIDVQLYATTKKITQPFRGILHGIIGVHRSPPPKILAPPLDIKAPAPPLIYLVGLSAIPDPHIILCVGPPNTCVALKQFNLLPPNTLL